MTSNPFSAPRALQADGRSDPIGLPSNRPRLSWKIDGRDEPAPFRLLGATSRAELERRNGDVFDVTTANLAQEWPGPALASRQRVWWAVARGEHWSEPAFVEAPLWQPEEWEGMPITHPEWARPLADGPAALPQLRAAFTVPSAAIAARLYLTGAGVVIPYLNGRRAIDAELEPGYSDLRVTTLASAWDVTDLVRAGENTVEVTLASGIAYVPGGERYTKFERTGEPVWAQVRLEIHHVDGSSSVVVTDESWQSRLGPTVASHWYGGETQVDGHVTEWQPAVAVGGTAPIRWRSAPPIRVVDEFGPLRVHHRDGHRTVDFGVNSAGRPRLRLASAEPGRAVVMRPSELLRDEAVDQSTTGTPIWDSYTPEHAHADWAPVGVYHGARYWEVAGIAASESDDSLGFEVMRTDNQQVGAFSTSDPFLSRLHDIIDRAVQSNMFSVFTDCPHREKLGWLEQLHYCFPVLARGYDVRAHLDDMVRHMVEAQTIDGLIPNIAPELVVFNTYAVKGDIDAFRSDPNWGRAIVELPFLLYRHYGDPRIIVEALPAMTRYLSYLERRAVDDILDFGLGDWIEVDSSTPRDMVATHGWASTIDTAAQCAAAIGDDDTAAAWRARADRVWDAFRARFWNADSGVWGSDSQGSWALAWSARLGDAASSDDIAHGLGEAIRRAGETLTVGEVSLPHLVRALVDTGQSDRLSSLIRRQDAPGYGHQIAEGATSLAESWQGAEGQTGVASQNHFMLGVIDDWLTGDVAGLRQAAGAIGWQAIVVEPHLLRGVDDVRTSFDSPQGQMTVAWRRGGDGVVRVAVEVPAHVRVETVLPAGAVLLARVSDLDDPAGTPSATTLGIDASA